MKIAVLVKQVPDTYEVRRLDPKTGLVDRAANDAVVDEIGERAVELALQHREQSRDAEIVAVTMGPSTATKALRHVLAMGADSGIHILDDALQGADLHLTAKTLAAALRREGFDLIIAGSESSDGRGGMLPAMLAEHLGVPHLTSLASVRITSEVVYGERAIETGIVHAHASLPAVISVTDRAPEARFPSFKGIMSAKRKPTQTFSAGDLGVSTSSDTRSAVVAVAERPARVAGTKIVDEGNAATELAEFLAANHLIRQ